MLPESSSYNLLHHITSPLKNLPWLPINYQIQFRLLVKSKTSHSLPPPAFPVLAPTAILLTPCAPVKLAQVHPVHSCFNHCCSPEMPPNFFFAHFITINIHWVPAMCQALWWGLRIQLQFMLSWSIPSHRGAASSHSPFVVRMRNRVDMEFSTPNIEREGIPRAKMKKDSIAVVVSRRWRIWSLEGDGLYTHLKNNSISAHMEGDELKPQGHLWLGAGTGPCLKLEAQQEWHHL